MKKAHIHTFGCQMNLHDSEKMAGVLRGEGYEFADEPDGADLVIFNTCSIREKAEQKFLSSLGRLKRLKRKRPGLKIAVTGCIAQQMGGELIKKAPYVDLVIGPQNIHRIADIVNDGGLGAQPPDKKAEPTFGKTEPQDKFAEPPYRKIIVEDNPDIGNIELPALRKEKGRAWVNIMYGCNNFCSYCIVPYTRGRERSRPSGSILKEIEGLAAEGCREVTLLGQNVNSYARHNGGGFPALLEKINEVEGIERIRFVTSHPRDLTEALMDAVAGLRKLCEHIHLPLQSGSTRILGLMNRGYSYEEYREKIERLRRKVPGIAITSDIIAGFPTENPGDHSETMRALEEIEFDGIFAFKFSPRPYTAASRMEGQLPDEVKLERLHEILRLQDDITLGKNRALEETVQEVLVEGKSETDKFTGRTRTNKIVNFESSGALIGRMINIKIIKAGKHSLLGEALPK